jgi:CheY-like chemotaxis protein
MGPSIKKRSVMIGGRKTSISLEDQFWDVLNEIADAKGMSRSDLVNMVAREPGRGNLSSALRLFVLENTRLQAEHGEEARKPAKRVLVVDDDPLVLGLTAEMVEDIGCEVRTAQNGAEALAKIAGDEKIEILITDINMPDISGYDLAERAKQIRPGIRIILLSGRESTTHGLPLIRKPFLEADLKRVMSQTTGLC